MWLRQLAVIGASAGFAAAADGVTLGAEAVAQLACPLKILKVTATYGPAGAKYKPSFYADANPDQKDQLWVAADFENTADDVITNFSFRVLAWDAGGTEVFKVEAIYDFPVREKPAMKEWGWVVPGGEKVARVVFVPLVISRPGGRKWEADESFIANKLAALKEPK
jgi:hypothetical protein